MSQSVTKGAKKNQVSNPAKTRKPVSEPASAKTRTQANAAKSVRRAASDKAPARKAEKTTSKPVAKTAATKSAASKATTVKSNSSKTARVTNTPVKSARNDKATQANKTARTNTTTTNTTNKTSAKSNVKATASVASKTAAKKSVSSSTNTSTTKNRTVAASSAGKNRDGKVASASAKSNARPQSVASRTAAVPPPAPPRQPTRDEAAALRAFERAHKAFTRGQFVEASQQFRQLINDYGSATEVVARVRTYLSISEARSRAVAELPHDADALYDRGVVELNRGDYVAAQELFERTLKREPQAAHIHYGLAVVRTRLGAIPAALESLAQAVSLQQMLRIRALQDQDLAPLRNEPDFEQLVSASR